MKRLDYVELTLHFDSEDKWTDSIFVSQIAEVQADSLEEAVELAKKIIEDKED